MNVLKTTKTVKIKSGDRCMDCVHCGIMDRRGRMDSISLRIFSLLSQEPDESGKA